MVGDVTPYTPNIFSAVLDDLQKWPLWGVRETVSPSPPRGAAPIANGFRKPDADF